MVLKHNNEINTNKKLFSKNPPKQRDSLNLHDTYTQRPKVVTLTTFVGKNRLLWLNLPQLVATSIFTNSSG
jgi:hypothetical protein